MPLDGAVETVERRVPGHGPGGSCESLASSAAEKGPAGSRHRDRSGPRPPAHAVTDPDARRLLRGLGVLVPLAVPVTMFGLLLLLGP